MKGVNSSDTRRRPIFEKEEVLNNNGRYSKALNLSYCISLDEIDFYEKFCTIIYSVFPNKSKRWFLLKFYSNFTNSLSDQKPAIYN